MNIYEQLILINHTSPFISQDTYFTLLLVSPAKAVTSLLQFLIVYKK